MSFTLIDTLIFFAFVALVVGVSLMKSGGVKGSEDYFLAGRGLSWPLIGFSLIAANISTEQFVGMSGQAASDIGLAVASYEWVAAITLVFVAFVSLPKFLKSGIYTMPQFLEDRFTGAARTIMSVLIIIIYVCVTITAVIFSGAMTADTLFGGIALGGYTIGVVEFSWIIAIMAAIYVFFGGLKACAWADLIQGIALILGGVLITYFAFAALGSSPIEQITYTKEALSAGLADTSGTLDKFLEINSDKLNMFLAKEHSVLPWTALMFGIWIPNFYYWGFNQYIAQRTLGASSLQEGQKGVLFAGYMKLIVPFIIIFPGIIAFNLFAADQADEAKRDEGIVKSNAKAIALVEYASGVEISPITRQVAGREVVILSESDISAIKANHESMKAAGKAPILDADRHFIKYNEELMPNIIACNEKIIAANSAESLQKVSLTTYKFDSALGLLIKKLIPDGFKGFILAALLGAVVSSLASMLNAASTIFTIDIYKKLINKDASDSKQVMIGKTCVVVFAIFGALIAPLLADPRFGGIFTFIQEFQGYLSPGILAVFIVGFFSKKTPRFAGVLGLIASPLVYGYLQFAHGDISFLNRMSFTCIIVLLIMLMARLAKPMKEAVVFKVDERFNTETSSSTKVAGLILIVLVVILYVIFSPLVMAS